jgi:hypothetical protein
MNAYIYPRFDGSSAVTQADQHQDAAEALQVKPGTRLYFVMNMATGSKFYVFAAHPVDALRGCDAPGKLEEGAQHYFAGSYGVAKKPLAQF